MSGTYCAWTWEQHVSFNGPPFHYTCGCILPLLRYLPAYLSMSHTSSTHPPSTCCRATYPYKHMNIDSSTDSISLNHSMYLSPCLSVVLHLGPLCILVTPISTHHFWACSKLSLALGGSILCLFLGNKHANPAKQHGNIKMSCT